MGFNILMVTLPMKKSVHGKIFYGVVKHFACHESLK